MNLLPRSTDHDADRLEPIFIVGAPRSGTTLLRNMLNRHPQIALCDETYYFYYVLARRRRFGDLAHLDNRRLVVERYLATSRIRRLGLDTETLARVLLREGTSYGKLFTSLLRFYAQTQGKVRFGEKTPQHALEIGTLCQMFPNCRIVHIIRDPRDVVASLMRMPWGEGSVSGNARIWRSCVAAAERAAAGRPNVCVVRYEALVRDPRTELERICQFLGERFIVQMLVAEPQERTDLWWFQRAQGQVTRDRIEKWREQLSPRQIAIVEWIAMPWLATVGYTPVGKSAPLRHRVGSLVFDAWRSAWKRLRRLPRLWYTWFRPTELAAEEAWIDRH